MESFKYSEGLLLSDLLYLYKKTKDKRYFDEIKMRLFFCGLDMNAVNEFMRFEGEILDMKEYEYDKPFLDTPYIVGKKDKKFIFDNPDLYMYDPYSDNSKTLALSETLTILNEARFLTISNQINDYKAKEEIFALSYEEEQNWLFYEFNNRVEHILRCANSIMNGPSSSLYDDEIKILYENEMQICILKWNGFDIAIKEFIPYTEQYYIKH